MGQPLQGVTLTCSQVDVKFQNTIQTPFALIKIMN